MTLSFCFASFCELLNLNSLLNARSSVNAVPLDQPLRIHLPFPGPTICLLCPKHNGFSPFRDNMLASPLRPTLSHWVVNL